MAALSLGEAVLNLSKTSAPDRLFIPALLRLRPLDALPDDTRADANDEAQQHDPGWGVGRCAPLFIAARRGATEFVAALLEAGADTEWTCDDGSTALHVAARHGHVESAQQLVEAGADLDALSKAGETPLMEAARHDKPAAITLLLRADADWSLKNKDGKTALALAVEEIHTSVAALLYAAADGPTQLDPRCAAWAAARAASKQKAAEAEPKTAEEERVRALDAHYLRQAALKVPQNAAVESVENPLADEGPGSDIEQPDAGTFPLTVRDMFTNTHVVEVTPETRIFEVKELLRAEKDESMDYLDALVLLHNREPLDDEATVGSHGLSWETTVGISNQDPAKGRERRRERGKRAIDERLAAEARARRKQLAKLVLAACGAVGAVLLAQLFGVGIVLCEALACATGYVLWSTPEESAAVRCLWGALLEDEPLPVGTRVRIPYQHRVDRAALVSAEPLWYLQSSGIFASAGDGVYERFERRKIGANAHFIRFPPIGLSLNGQLRELERGKFKPEAEDTRCCPVPIGLEEWQARPAEGCRGRVSRASQKLPRGLRAAAGVLLWQLALARIYFTAGCGACTDGATAECVGGLLSGDCACESGYTGEACEGVVPAQCVAGMGRHGVVYNGTAYRTLDDAPPRGWHRYDSDDDAYESNDGSQAVLHYDEGYENDGWGPRARVRPARWVLDDPNYLPLPPGYALAPPDADTLAVIVAHSWSTRCVVTADGNGYTWSREMPWSPRLPTRCADNKLNSSSSGAGGEYTATQESSRVLVRCR